MSSESVVECPSLMELEALVEGDSTDESVRSHLESCPKCAKRAEMIRENNELLAELSNVGPPGPVAPSADLAAGIEGYEIGREIHRGAQGVVYEAEQLATHRKVALKVLLSGALATTRQRRRFEREIDIVAALRHPNIVTVYDSGATPDGRHYFAMEHIEGVPLNQYVRERLTGVAGGAWVRRALELFSKVCAAVSYAHQRGVIHRDLKPANILIDGNGEPHVLDFGLAKTAGAGADDEGGEGGVTMAGEFMGTLAYASPEQAGGDPDEIDVRSDVFSLGVILYQMMTGRYPHPVDGSLKEVLLAITEVEPRAMNERGGTVADGPRVRVDDELETIVRKALAKEKGRRYQSAESLRQDIDRYLAGEPIEAKRDSGWYVLRKAVLRYRVQTGVAAAFVVLLAVFAAAMSVQYQRASLEAAKANTIRVFLEDTFGSVEPDRLGGETTVRQVLDEAVHWIDIALGDQPEIRASVRTTIGNSYRSLGRFAEAEEQLLAALATRRELYGDEHRLVAESINTLGLLRRSERRYAEAEAVLFDGLAMRRKLLGADHMSVATSLMNLAGVYLGMERFEEAESALEECGRIRRGKLGADHPDVAMVEFQLARVAESAGDLEAARARYARALMMRRARLHEDHPDLARSVLALGGVLLELGSADEAVGYLEEGVELRRRLAGDDWRVGAAMSELGRALIEAGRLGEAEERLVEAFGILKRELGEGDDLTRGCEVLLGEVRGQ